MPVMIYDPILEQEIRTRRDNADGGRRDEVWEGVLVVPPMANNEHQTLVMNLCYSFASVVDRGAGDVVLAGCNVSDRAAGWTENYREPDAVVYLATNPAKDAGTHWVGGPDLAVEITSPGEDPRLKLDFYAKVNTRELLIVDRYPWKVELYQLQSGKLVLVGSSDVANQAVLASSVLPLTFQVQPGTARPVVRLAHTVTGQVWSA